MRPICKCHGVEMYPNNSDGGWRCRVKVRDRQRAADNLYYHRADGGYIKRRRRTLSQQRTDILARLAELEQEAVTSC